MKDQREVVIEFSELIERIRNLEARQFDLQERNTALVTENRNLKNEIKRLQDVERRFA